MGWPFENVGPMRLILVLFFLVEGGASIMFAFEHRRQFSGRWAWMLASGVVDIVLASIIIFGLPGTSAWTMGLLSRDQYDSWRGRPDRDGIACSHGTRRFECNSPARRVIDFGRVVTPPAGPCRRGPSPVDRRARRLATEGRGTPRCRTGRELVERFQSSNHMGCSKRPHSVDRRPTKQLSGFMKSIV